MLLELIGFQEHPLNSATDLREPFMPTFYFDTKDGIPIRDRAGLELPAIANAIEHSKELARRLGSERPNKDRTLSIVVIDESGAEVHRERVYPDVQKPTDTPGT
jgi:Domain of unknown function (DUF6894)